MKKLVLVISVISISILLFLTIVSFSIKPVGKYIVTKIADFIIELAEKGLEERQKIIENGGIVAGKDTVKIWNDRYEILRHMEENHLSVHLGRYDDETVLESIEKYDTRKGKLYIISKEGYAVIDENNICRVFVTVPPNEFVSGYTEDKYGNREYFSRKLESEYIVYLDEFEDFSKDEIDYFEKLMVNE